MLNARLAGDHQYRKLLFTWLSRVMSSMLSFVLSFSHEMSRMRLSRTDLSQFLRVFLPTLLYISAILYGLRCTIEVSIDTNTAAVKMNAAGLAL